jgi:hypothetical protein
MHKDSKEVTVGSSWNKITTIYYKRREYCIDLT